MAKDKKSFVLYSDLIGQIDHLTDKEKGLLFQHLLEYVNDLNPVLEDRILIGVWKPIENQLKRDLKKYDEVRKKRSEAGKRSAEKRALTKQQNSTNPTSVESVQQTSTNPTVNDTVTVNDILLNNNNKKIDNTNFKNECISDVQFVEVTAMQTKQSLPSVLKYLNTYDNRLIQLGEQKKDLKDYKHHFTNWLNKQDLKKTVKKTKNPYADSGLPAFK